MAGFIGELHLPGMRPIFVLMNGTSPCRPEPREYSMVRHIIINEDALVAFRKMRAERHRNRFVFVRDNILLEQHAIEPFVIDLDSRARGLAEDAGR
ncbi:MAG: hypothetical protein R3C49_13490 [Planctomycetaceae bacterium]